MIYDVFLFSDETELLALRCATLRYFPDLVHIAVEGTTTFAGEPKDIVGRDRCREPLAEFYGPERIEYHVVDGLPAPIPDRWRVETALRNSAFVGLCERVRPGDIILLSDVDEIPNPGLLANVLWASQNGPLQPMTFYQRMFYYYLNLELNDVWAGPVVLSGATLTGDQRTPQDWRDLRTKLLPQLDGGWHFSFQGGLGSVHSKVRRFAHAEHDTAATHEALESRFTALTDPFDRPGHTLTPRRVDFTFPEPVQQNAEYYRSIDMLLPDPPRSGQAPLLEDPPCSM